MSRRPYRVIASNLHVGGGVQVGASLIDEVAELSRCTEWAQLITQTSFEVSSAVARNARAESLTALGCDVVDRRPGSFRHLLRDLRRRRAANAVVFGPIYSLPRASRRVMGYADVTSVYASPTGTPGVRRRVRGWLSRTEASCQDVLIVETDAMAKQVKSRLGGRAPRTVVIANTLNERVRSADVDPALEARVARARASVDVLLAYPTRPYPHKNLAFLAAFAEAMAARGSRVRFALTLTDAEWQRLHPDVHAVADNLGELSVDQIRSLVTSADGVFFPSLLEAYSATPVEALALGVPLYASDRDFVRSVCGDAAVYFDPIDPDSAANVVAAAVVDPGGTAVRKRRGLELVDAMPTARQRAEGFLAALYDRTLVVSSEGAAS